MDNKDKKLYRKVNRKSSYQVRWHETKKVHYRWSRHTKKSKQQAMEGVRLIPMKSGKDTYVTSGYDYTPLFHYLLKQVGRKWDEVYSKVIPRLNTTEPVFWMVDVKHASTDEYFRAGESTYFSKLYVNDEGILLKVNPNLSNISPSCDCHTHSFNGNVVGNKNYDKTWR